MSPLIDLKETRSEGPSGFGVRWNKYSSVRGKPLHFLHCTIIPVRGYMLQADWFVLATDHNWLNCLIPAPSAPCCNTLKSAWNWMKTHAHVISLSNHQLGLRQINKCMRKWGWGADGSKEEELGWDWDLRFGSCFLWMPIKGLLIKVLDTLYSVVFIHSSTFTYTHHAKSIKAFLFTHSAML